MRGNQLTQVHLGGGGHEGEPADPGSPGNTALNGSHISLCYCPGIF